MERDAGGAVCAAVERDAGGTVCAVVERDVGGIVCFGGTWRRSFIPK